MGEPEAVGQSAPPQPPPPPLIDTTAPTQEPQNQQQTPHQPQVQLPSQQLFSGVKFFLAQCNKPEHLKSILNEAGAKHINYLTESVTHCIADTKCPEAEEAKELFDKPVVTSTWVHQSLKANILLPVEAFSPLKSIFRQVVVAFSRHLCLEDVQSLAAMLTFYGASVTQDPLKATHLIVPSASASDLKPDKQLHHNQSLKLVSPDWILESVKQTSMCDELLFNPLLLLPPKPPTPPPVIQPPKPQPSLLTPYQKFDTKLAAQQTTEGANKKDKIICSPIKSSESKDEPKNSDSYIRQQTQCQKTSHPQNRPPVPQVPSQVPRMRAPSGVTPRGIPQHKFRPLLPSNFNAGTNPQSVLQHQQRPPTLDVQQPKKVTINYGSQYMKPSPYQNNLDSQPHTPHPHQFHQNSQPNQIQTQSQQTVQHQQYPFQHPNQIQHVVQHQHTSPNQLQVQHPSQHQHQLHPQYQAQTQHQQYVQTKPHNIQPNHIHVQPQNQPYQMQHQQYLPPQDPQVTQTYTNHQAQQNYQIHDQPSLCQPVPQDMGSVPRAPIRPVQTTYMNNQQIVRPNQVRAPGIQHKTHPMQSTYSQFDDCEIMNNVNQQQSQTLPHSNVQWQVVPGFPNRMSHPQHQQFSSSTHHSGQQQPNRQPVVQRPPVGSQLQANMVGIPNQQFTQRLPPQLFQQNQQTQQKQVYYPQDRDPKSIQENTGEKFANNVARPQPPIPVTQQLHMGSTISVHGHENSQVSHPSIFNQTQESSMEKIKAQVPQVDAEVEYFGHDSKVNVCQNAPFTGCRFKFIGYSSVDPILRSKWVDSIKEAGGNFQDKLDQATHLICENRLNNEYCRALENGIRCVTIYWINDVLAKNKLTYPWKAIHLPIPFEKSDKPLKDQVIGITNFRGRDRKEVKEMILMSGARFTDYFSSSNTLIICGNVGGDKYERALEWGIPIANCRLLSDVLLKGDFDLGKMLTTTKYQLFNVNEPLRIFSYHDVRDLMKPWTKPLTISEMSSTTVKNPVNGTPLLATTNLNDDSGIATGSNNSEQEMALTSEKQNLSADLHDTTQCKSITNNENIQTSNSMSDEKIVTLDTVENAEANKSPKIKRRSTKPIRILFTHLNSSLLEKLKNCADKFGLVLADNYLSCTHLVVDRISRTRKFICAFSHADYILSYKWLIESQDADDLLDEKYFMLQDKEGEEVYSVNLVYSLMKRKKRQGLLFNNLVFYVTPTVVTTVSNVKEMIESAGGIVAHRKPPSKIQVDQLRSEGKRLVVITCEEDYHISSMFDFSDVDLVDKEFVISGILRQDIDYESHRIEFKNPPDKSSCQLSEPSPPKKLRIDNSSCYKA